MSDEKYLEEASDLELTRGVRKRIIAGMTHKEIPKDPEELRLLLTTLSDLDRASLGRMKIKSEDSNNSDNINAQSAIAALLMKVDPSKVALAGRSDRSIPLLPNDLPPPDIIPGETALGTQGGTYEQFAKANFTNT